ncbi:MAG: Ltp family lipoprotein, partial [Actinobacteria bacterium]|nr:Ltp family lipoprotein [Actinomycetota bacterium]
YEQADAEFAVDHIAVDWNAEAAKSAQAYLDLTSFSRQGLVDQLVFEGFTADRKPRAEKIVRFGRQIGARKVSSAAGSLFRDLTLSMFLRMGGRATVEQYGYSVPHQSTDQRGDGP